MNPKLVSISVPARTGEFPLSVPRPFQAPFLVELRGTSIAIDYVAYDDGSMESCKIWVYQVGSTTDWPEDQQPPGRCGGVRLLNGTIAGVFWSCSTG